MMLGNHIKKTILSLILFCIGASVCVAEGVRLSQPVDADADILLAESGAESNNPVTDDSRISFEYDSEKDCNPTDYEVTLFTSCKGEDSERLWRQTKIMMVAGIGVAGFIALLPEDLSGWEKGTWERGQLLEQWWDNVKAGPVWDEDVWYINLIGHPYFGGVYYQAARKSGYNQWNSFTYSALMSTFYWEYGLEAFAEVPSIQDLVVTPIGGWLYGEWAHNKEKEIRRNGNLAMGSEFWGSVALFLLDPVGSLDSWCCVSKKVEVTAFNIAHWPAQQYSPEVDAGKDYWGIRLAIEF